MREHYTRYPRPVLWLLPGGTLPGRTDGAPIPAFYISTTVVTNEQYEAYDPGHERSPLSPRDDDPATRVSWVDAAGYCAWYAGVARKPIRLPTEIEWEYSARGGVTTRHPFPGKAALLAAACVKESSGGRCGPAQAGPPNAFGLYGTIGTVWEWTSAEATQGGGRVQRGGSFLTAAAEAGLDARRVVDGSRGADDAGFRIVREFNRPRRPAARTASPRSP